MKKIIVIASFSGALAVILGAFGAHALKNSLTPDQLNSFETGIRYQIIHSLLLLIVVIIPVLSISHKQLIAKFLMSGILCFSGSIYMLSLGVIPSKYIWFVTPIGGLLLIISWVLTGVYALKTKTTL